MPKIALLPACQVVPPSRLYCQVASGSRPATVTAAPRRAIVGCVGSAVSMANCSGVAASLATPAAFVNAAACTLTVPVPLKPADGVNVAE